MMETYDFITRHGRQSTLAVVDGTQHAGGNADRMGCSTVREAKDLGTDRTATAKIMIVDDEPINIKVVEKYLKLAGYKQFLSTSEPTHVMAIIRKERPDVVLLDIMMPVLSGLEVLKHIRDEAELTHLPVIILTASTDEDTKATALQLGATDFLTKPVNATDLIPRIRNSVIVKAHHDHLRDYASELERQVRQRTMELAASRLELIHCLARAAEYRDNETGRHVLRVGKYAGIIAQELGLAENIVELIEHAAPLHDLGKIGIPDAILLKPGKLTPDEFEFIQTHSNLGKRTFEPLSPAEWRSVKSHTVLGEGMLDIGSSPILAMAGKIALTHHEKWDGTGYPLHLAGEDIPLEGRITAVADVFDALSSKRPYKPALPLDECFAIMKEGRGNHFDPQVIDAFLACRADMVQIQIDLADVD